MNNASYIFWWHSFCNVKKISITFTIFPTLVISPPSQIGIINVPITNGYSTIYNYGKFSKDLHDYSHSFTCMILTPIT